jgi:hypothetical protein
MSAFLNDMIGFLSSIANNESKNTNIMEKSLNL